ncbi:MAG TPA: hypothetical protein VKR42_10505 [Ktedonobacteraceae bacterium]|nr:hypothetical protein [Ktedonobacteraceae bacterium]
MMKREDRPVNLFAMLLKALVVRSTTQKDKAFPQSQANTWEPVLLGDTLTISCMERTSR